MVDRNRVEILDLLNDLSLSQLETVIFRYGAPKHHLSSETQNKRAIDLIQYAIDQKEGVGLSQLLTVIHEVMDQSDSNSENIDHNSPDSFYQRWRKKLSNA